jgi:16S rRNA (adenine1518-N6/adenine1519-N6)-dimethyltransferase
VRYRAFVQAAFGLRRKQLVRVVRTIASLDAETASAIIAACGLTNDLRPEVLTAEDFARLVSALAAHR